MLVAAPRLPYPPSDGGRIAMFDAVRRLGELGHEVHVVAFAAPSEMHAVVELRRHCASVTVEQPPAAWLLRGLVGDPPATLARYFSRRMSRSLARTAEATAVEVIELQSLHMAVYGRALASYPRVFRPQNVEHVIWERYAESRSIGIARAVVRLQARRIKAYEARCLSDAADATLAVSEADRAALSVLAPNAIVDLLPMGVDTTYFAVADEVAVDPWSIVLTGSFDWAPKRHNLLVLVREVFPLIRALAPAARLTVVGKGLSGDGLAAVQAQDAVEYTGAVPDVRPYIARAAVVVNYVESGSGIALKVLQAMAMGRPVVSNALGVEGIAARHGTHVVIATTKAEFARAVAATLMDRALAARIGSAGLALVTERYSSAALGEELARYYGRVVAARGPSQSAS